jgi:hypothetical protein
MHAFGQTQPYGNEWIDFSKAYFKFGVREQRFYRINFTTLQAQGLANTPVEQFQLWRDGKEVPLFTSVSSGMLPTTGYIEFFGKPNTGAHETELYLDPTFHTQPQRSFFSDTAWYFLTVNPGGINKRFTNVENLVNTTLLPPDSFYLHTSHGLAGQNSFNGGRSRTVEADFLRSSSWDMGEGFCSPFFSTTRTTQIILSNMRAFSGGPPMQLFYAVAGATSADRKVIMKMNDVLFDSVRTPFFHLSIRNISNIPLAPNINNDSINFKFNSDNPVWFENVTVNGFRLIYPRRFFHNLQNPIELSIPANTTGNHIRMAGLPNGNIAPVLYDLENLKRYIGVIKPDSSLFALEPSATTRTLVIGTQVANHTRVISALRPVTFRDFSKEINQGNYIIISNRMLRTGPVDQIEAYRQYRSSMQGGGYQSMVVEMDELAEQFCFGHRKNPLSIRRFLNYSMDHFRVKPKMVFLIGRGSNYINSYISGSNAVNEILNAVPTWGMPASDNLLAAKSNASPVPMLPIGRLAAISAKEVADYLDKVKMYEALQRTRPSLPSENEWRKKVLHLAGGDDENLADSILGKHLYRYADTIKAPFSGAIVNQYSRPNNPLFAKNMRQIESNISSGVGLITYFGHSSSSSIDFNLGSPNLYSNSDGRYPVFIANGCRAGNIFDFNTRRLTTREVSLSDNFTFSPNSGSIAFISNTDLTAINYQNLMTSEWYRAFSRTKFGKTIGEIQHEALRRAYVRTGESDMMNRWNVEQNLLHADPAIIPFLPTLPDFAVETRFISIIPNRLLTDMDSVNVQINFFNLGMAVPGEVLLTLERELPNGNTKKVYQKIHSNLYNEDSVVITLGLKSIFEEGNGFLIARIDPENDWNETDKDNNIALQSINMDRNYISPIFPYNYGIINEANPILKASTTNPIEEAKSYYFQIDTTILFNSPLLESHDTTMKGGVIAWQPSEDVLPNTTYYWRVSKSSMPFNDDSRIFSFVYIPGSQTGFNQSHFYQHVNSNGIQIGLRESGKWEYLQKDNNLFISHGIFSSSGNEDTHFSVSVNGDMKIYSACIGSSIIFNLFDSLTFEPIRNAPFGAYGSADSCQPGREYNFEFRYSGSSNRKLIMDFLDVIPKGTYVTARLVADRPYDSLLVKYWKADTAIFGSGNSLFHSLVKNGFYDLDSLNSTKTFFFMFRKDDSISFKPNSVFSRGLNDRINASVYATITDKAGSVSSLWMGPAKKWNKADWKILQIPDNTKGEVDFKLQLWGKAKTGPIQLIKEWDSLEDTESIEDINANIFPFLQYKMKVSGEYGMEPPQIDYWRLYYENLPDGAWCGNDLFTINKDTLVPLTDFLSLQLAFKNTSENFLDSIPVNVFVNELYGNPEKFYSTKFKALNPGDTAILNIEKIFSMPEGEYQLYIEANENGSPLEENYFNNKVIIPILVKGDALSVNQLKFDAKRKNNIVELIWETTRNEKVKSYSIEHSNDNQGFETIAENVTLSNELNGLEQYQNIHINPAFGYNYYRLRIRYTDGHTKYSEIRKVWFEKDNYVKIAPNPFHQYFNLQPVDNMQQWELKIFDVSGKLVKAEKGIGGKKISLENTANGIYWLHWQSGDKIQIIKILKH